VNPFWGQDELSSIHLFIGFKGILEGLPRLNRINDVTDFQIVGFHEDGVPARAKESERIWCQAPCTTHSENLVDRAGFPKVSRTKGLQQQ
jgi:hypothetical protein